MWFLPSRQRPDNLVRFFNAYKATGADSPGVVWLDDDDDIDPYIALLGALPDKWQILIKSRRSLGEILNELFRMFRDEPWYGLLADDIAPRTEAWDRKMIEAVTHNGLAYSDDLLNGEAHATHLIVGGDMVRELGWVALPGCKRLYIDNALFEYAKRKGTVTYLPDVVIEHMHFSNGKAPIDETYLKPDSGGDRAIYETWLASL